MNKLVHFSMAIILLILATLVFPTGIAAPDPLDKATINININNQDETRPPPPPTSPSTSRERGEREYHGDKSDFFGIKNQDVSYGATDIELSTGEKVTCQNAVQEVLTEVIIRMYERHHQEEKEAYENLTTLPYPIKLFGKTTLRKLATTIPLGALKSLRGLDYYAAGGSEAFDSMRKDLKEKVLPRASSEEDITAIQNLEISLQQAHRHLKTEFKEEISSSSPVAAHCSVWALSDPTTPDFSSVCDHQHDSRCSECDMRSTSLKEFKHLVQKLFPSDTFEDRETRFEMLENINCIEEWVKHEVRGYHQNLKEKDFLGSLDNRRSAHLTFDLAMKLLDLSTAIMSAEIKRRLLLGPQLEEAWSLIISKMCSKQLTPASL